MDTSAAAPRNFCYRCHKAEVTCICGVVSVVPNRTGITVLQHPHERFHSIGSVRIAKLGLARVRVEECIPWQPNDAAVARIPAGAALLYPSAGAERLDRIETVGLPEHLVVIDGTWFQAKKIYDTHPRLQQMRAISISRSRPSEYRIRREPKEGYLATIEAIVEALRIIEPDTAGIETLLEAFEAMVDRQLEYLG